VLTALVAVVLFGSLNFFAADRLLRKGTESELANLAANRSRSIEISSRRFLGRVAATAADRAMVDALGQFQRATVDLAGAELDPAQVTALRRFYDESVVAPINETGLADVTADELLPRTNAGRWMQYHYTVPDTRRAAPATSYDVAMSAYDEFLSATEATFGGGDLLLVDTDGVVVYSSERHIDLGTSLAAGPYADSDLARLVLDGVPNARAGDAQLSNFAVYLPAQAHPVLFAGAAVRDGTQIVGTLVIELPIEGLDRITTAGLTSDGGESQSDVYVVAADTLLQSTPEAWNRDPDAYLAAIDDPRIHDLVAALGSPVGVQPIDTAPVRSAIDGERFVGQSTNALGQRTYSAAQTIDVPGVQWVVVTELPASDVRRPLLDYLGRMAIVIAAVLPIAALAGVVLARRLNRPIPVAVAAARAVADGERRLALPPLGNDEFGDLSRRLTKMAATLERQEGALDDEYQRKRDLLLSVLPAHVVQDDGRVSDAGGSVTTATVVAIAIEVDLNEVDDLTATLAAVADLEERLAAERHMVRIRAAADRSLFVSGPGDDGADAALDFASAFAEGVRSHGVGAGTELTAHLGVSTGPVATGVLSSGSLTFGAWGEPVRRALAISALSTTNEVLVDDSSIQAAGADWQFVPAEGVIDLTGEPMPVSTLVVPDPAPTPGP